MKKTKYFKKKIFPFLLFFLFSINGYSQCGCDVSNCATIYPNVTLFNIYYGDIITLNAPPLPNYWLGENAYAWFTVIDKTTDDPNQSKINYLTNSSFSMSQTINPLEYLQNVVLPTQGYFMCRTLSRSSSASSSPCFYGRSFKVVFNDVPPPILNTSSDISICQGDTVQLSASAQVGTIQWHTGSNTGPIIGTGNSITVRPNANTTYYLNANNGSVLSNAGNSIYVNRCNSISISVNVIVNQTPSSPIITQNANILHSSSLLGNQWYNQNGIINGAINQDYTPTISGNYYVTNTASGCSSTSTVFNYTFLATDEFILNNDLKIYPNPTNSKINIEFGNQFNFVGSQVKLSNVLGQEFYNFKINQQKTEVSLSSIATKGLSFLSIVNSEGVVIATKKVVLK